jgi:transcriptional regulator with XRE-family HTH domain
MTGRDLKLRRVAANVKVYELATRMGVHSSRVSQIEALADVTPFTESRYIAALDAAQVATSGHQRPVEAPGAA